MRIMKEFIEYISTYPYWEFFKTATYYYFHPIQNYKRSKTLKSYRDIIDEKKNGN